MQAIKGDCPNCRRQSNACVIAEYVDHFDGQESPNRSIWRILRCAGCDTVFVSRTEELESCLGQGIDFISTEYWPRFSKLFKPNLPLTEVRAEGNLFGSKGEFRMWLESPALPRLLDDFHRCLECGLRVPAAVAARTVLEAAARELGAERRTFKQTLKQLMDDGWVSRSEMESLLEPLVEAGNAAVHRGWAPTPDQLEIIAKVLYGFIDRVFVQTKHVDKMKRSVPQRSKP